MNTTSPFVLVKIDFDTHNTHTFSNGAKIQVEKKYRTDFNKRYANPDSGWVVALPREETINGSPVILSVGDYVFFHFHTMSQYNEVHIDGETYYRIHYSNIYFKYDLDTNDITPINQFILTEIMTKDTSVKLPGGVVLFGVGETVELTNKSTVAYKPPYIDSVSVGDVVYHRKNTHYDIELPDGRRLYRIREKDIVGLG